MSTTRNLANYVHAVVFEKNPVIFPTFETFESITGKKFFAIRRRREENTIPATFYAYKNFYNDCRVIVEALSDSNLKWLWNPYSFRIISFTYEIKSGRGGAWLGSYKFLLIINAELLPEEDAE